MKILQEYDHKGNHRLVIDGETSKSVRYDQPCFMIKDGVAYLGVSSYFSNELQSKGQIFKLESFGFSARDSEVCNFFDLEEICSWECVLYMSSFVWR